MSSILYCWFSLAVLFDKSISVVTTVEANPADDEMCTANLAIYMNNKFASPLFKVGIADFGKALRPYKSRILDEAILTIFPDDNNDLCDLGFLYELRSDSIPPGDIALLVDLEAGGCDVLTKSFNALTLQSWSNSRLKYIFFYHTDPLGYEGIPNLSLEPEHPVFPPIQVDVVYKSPKPTQLPTALSRSPSTIPTTMPSESSFPSMTSAPSSSPEPSSVPSVSSEPSSSSGPTELPSLSALPSSSRPSLTFSPTQTFLPTQYSTLNAPTTSPSTTTSPLATKSPLASSPSSASLSPNPSESPTEAEVTIRLLNPNVFDRNERDMSKDIREIERKRQERERQKEYLEDNDSLVFVSISREDSKRILLAIGDKVFADHHRGQRAEPQFGEDHNESWNMKMFLSTDADMANPPSCYVGYDQDDDDYQFPDDWNSENNNANTNTNNNQNNGQSSDNYSENAPGSFQIFKFILFSLLIASPCLRAIHLWWAGGGRVRLRRNDENHVTGLQYIPPMDNWFGISEPGEVVRPHDRLTHQQVMDLPEITYRKPVDLDDDDGIKDGGNEISDEDRSENTNVPADSIGNVDTKLSAITNTNDMSGNNSGKEQFIEMDDSIASEISFEDEPSTRLRLPTSPERVPSTITSTSNTSEKVPSSPRALVQKEDVPPDEEQQTPVHSIRTQRRLQSFTTTTCTTCSICIDEFEEGEKIRLLPRCGHAFHTNCILPWLTDRQGCCPLCKMGVLEDNDNGDNSNDNGNNSSDESGNNSNQEERVLL